MLEHAPHTPEGEAVWALIKACERQLRAHFGGIYALDLGAWLPAAAALDVDLPLLLELIPEIEPWIVYAWSKPE